MAVHEAWASEREAVLHEAIVAALALRGTRAREREVVSSLRQIFDAGFVDIATIEIRTALRNAVESEAYLAQDLGEHPRISRTDNREYFHTLPPTTFQAKLEVQATLVDCVSSLAEFESSVADSDETGIGRSLHHRLLSNEAIAGLARRAKQGALVDRNEIVVHNLRLVSAVSRPSAGKAVSELDSGDLFQEGALGAIRATEKFDPNLTFAFSTYATWWIRQQVTRAVADKGRTIRLPVHVVERLNAAGLAERYLDDPRSGELAAIAAAQELPDGIRNSPGIIFSPRPLDALTEEDQERFLADPVSGDKYSEIDEAGFTVEEILMNCTPIQVEVIAARLGLNGDEPRTLDAVGQSLGVTRERIRQIEAAGLKAAGATLSHLESDSFQSPPSVRSAKIKQVRDVLERVRGTVPSTRSHTPD